MKFAFGIWLLACALSSASEESDQKPSLPATIRGLVVLTYPASAQNELDRMPHVVPNTIVTAAVAAKINAALRREDSRGDAAAADCRNLFKEEQGKTSVDAWNRSVDVTMAGPRYLGIVVSDSYYCGGPYPDGGRLDFVYDLTTGRPVDWVKLFPAGASGKLVSAGDGSTMGLVVWPELMRRARAQADAECREVFDQSEDLGFSIGLDARARELVAQPVEFPHAVQACADEVRLSATDLRKLGFASEVAVALDAASLSRKR